MAQDLPSSVLKNQLLSSRLTVFLRLQSVFFPPCFILSHIGGENRSCFYFKAPITVEKMSPELFFNTEDTRKPHFVVITRTPIFQNHPVHFFRFFQVWLHLTWILLEAYRGTFKVGIPFINGGNRNRIVTVFIYCLGMNFGLPQIIFYK